ncbi:transglutaminase-like cysteine peptidase [Rhizobium populisoli]|uniref:transglutaminase-like cysteine peptidase n=1 Tax=Rhizobium populisoli TaxID=2859785 RepID=UPI0035E45FC8
MREGSFTLAPFAAVKFCLANQGQCEDTGGDQIVNLTEERRQELLSVNSGINRAIKPANDASGTDVWSLDVAVGDCEDYALTKKKNLLELGWPSRALRIAVGRTRSGEGHAVLVVKTSAGDLVLDNRSSTIREWTRTDLRWISMQSSQNPKLWVSINAQSVDAANNYKHW